MKIWIEQCQHYGHRLKWEYVSSFVKQVHCNGDSNVTQKEIDIAHGLRDLYVIILLINHVFLNSRYNNLYMFKIIVGKTPQGYVIKFLLIFHQIFW